jgi:hypothetical protein
LKYTVPVVIFSVMFNLPKFFEFTLEKVEIENYLTNLTEIRLKVMPTDLRLDDNYVYYYVNWSRLVVTGLVPLLSLGVLNLAIYRYI